MAARLGISRTPVREALRMLAAEGVVELVHNRGARVVRWSAQDIDEVYRLRGLLEGHGAALAARSATAEQVDHVRSCQRRYEEALCEGPDSARSAACNDDFHAAVMAAGGSPRLAALLGTISSAPLVARGLRQYGDDDRNAAPACGAVQAQASTHRLGQAAGLGQAEHRCAVPPAEDPSAWTAPVDGGRRSCRRRAHVPFRGRPASWTVAAAARSTTGPERGPAPPAPQSWRPT